MEDLKSEEGFGYNEEEEVGEEMSEEGGNEADRREGRVREKDLREHWIICHWTYSKSLQEENVV